MEVLQPTLTKIREACSLLGLEQEVELPRVVAVGRQSAGKSSVLDFVAGRDLFPIGTKGVTKRPIEVRMVSSQHADDSFTFLGQLYSSAANVRAAIEAEMRVRSGENQPLTVTFSSSRNPNVTLVDLPAIDSGPEGADAPLQYITERNSLILAVFPATESSFDESPLVLARKVDPYLSRTFVVVTKVDLLRREADLLKAMDQSFSGVQLGAVAIICRSQTDITVKVSIAQHRRVERTFFQTHMKRGQQGIDRLLTVVCTYLHACVVKVSGKIRKTAEKQLQRLKEEARERCGLLGGDSAEAQSTLMYSLLMEYDRAVKGKFAGSGEIYDIRMSMSSALSAKLASGSPLTQAPDEQLITLIANSRGIGGSIFLPRLALELLIDLEFPSLLQESLGCLELVCSEIRSIAYGCTHTGRLKNFPALCAAVRREVDAFLDQGHSEACQHISDLIEVQRAYLNLQHPSFIGDTKALMTVIEAVDWENPPSGRWVEGEVLRTLAASYSQILRTLICDQIPKVVICYLITPLQEGVFERLASILITKERYRELLAEVGEEKTRRDELQAQITQTEQAMAALTQAESIPLY